jgi:hypothetical protein
MIVICNLPLAAIFAFCLLPCLSFSDLPATRSLSPLSPSLPYLLSAICYLLPATFFLTPRFFDFDNPEWMVNNIAQSNQIELDESAR